jgi:hypothetical protein
VARARPRKGRRGNGLAPRRRQSRDRFGWHGMSAVGQGCRAEYCRHPVQDCRLRERRRRVIHMGGRDDRGIGANRTGTSLCAIPSPSPANRWESTCSSSGVAMACLAGPETRFNPVIGGQPQRQWPCEIGPRAQVGFRSGPGQDCEVHTAKRRRQDLGGQELPPACVRRTRRRAAAYVRQLGQWGVVQGSTWAVASPLTRI